MLRKKLPEAELKKPNNKDEDLSWDLSSSFRNGTSKNALTRVSSRDIVFTKRSSPASVEEAWSSRDNLKGNSVNKSSKDESWSWKPEEKNISYLTDQSQGNSGRFSEESSKPVERATRLKVQHVYSKPDDSASESGSAKFSEESSAEVGKRKGHLGPNYPEKVDLIESIEWKEDSESVNELANTQRELLDIFEMEEQRIKRKAQRLGLGDSASKSPKQNKKNDPLKPVLKVHFQDDFKSSNSSREGNKSKEQPHKGLEVEEIGFDGQKSPEKLSPGKQSNPPGSKPLTTPGTNIPKIIKKTLPPAANSPPLLLPKAIEIVPKELVVENDYSRILDDLNKTTEMLDAISSIKKPTTTRLPSIKKNPISESIPSLPSQDEIPMVSFDALSADRQASMQPEVGEPSVVPSQPQKPVPTPIIVMKKPVIRLPGTKIPAVVPAVGGTTSRSTDSPVNKEKKDIPGQQQRSLNPLESRSKPTENTLAATTRHDRVQELGLTGLESLKPDLLDEDQSIPSMNDPVEPILSWENSVEPVVPVTPVDPKPTSPPIPPLEHALLGKVYVHQPDTSIQSGVQLDSRDVSVLSGCTFNDDQSRVFGAERRSVVSGISEYEPKQEDGVDLVDLSEESTIQINVPIQFNPQSIRAKIDHSIFGKFTPGAKVFPIPPRIEELIKGIFTKFKHNAEGQLELMDENDSMGVEGSEQPATNADTKVSPFPSQGGYLRKDQLPSLHHKSKSHVRELSIDRNSADSLLFKPKLELIRLKKKQTDVSVYESEADLELDVLEDPSVDRDKLVMLRSADMVNDNLMPTDKMLLMMKEHPRPRKNKSIEPCLVTKVDFFADIYSIERADGDDPTATKNPDDSLELAVTKAALKIDPHGIWYKRRPAKLPAAERVKAKDAEEINPELGVPFSEIEKLAAKGLARGELLIDEICRRDRAIRNCPIQPEIESHEASYIILDPSTGQLKPIETDEGGSILPGFPGANMRTIKKIGDGEYAVSLNEDLQVTLDEYGRPLYLIDPYTGKPIRPGGKSYTRITDNDTTANDPLNPVLLNMSAGLKSPRRNRFEEINDQSMISDAEKTRILALPEEPKPLLNRAERQKYVYYKDPRKPIRMVQKFEVPKPRQINFQELVSRAKSVGRSAQGDEDDVDFDETRINHVLDQPLFNQRPHNINSSRTSRKSPVQYKSVKYPHLAKMLAQMMVEDDKTRQQKRMAQFRVMTDATLQKLHQKTRSKSNEPGAVLQESAMSVVKSQKSSKQKISEGDLHEWYGTSPETNQAKYERNNKYNVLAHSNNPQYLYSKLYKSYYQEVNDNRPGVKEKIEEIEKREREKLNINTKGNKMYITFDEKKPVSQQTKAVGQSLPANV